MIEYSEDGMIETHTFDDDTKKIYDYHVLFTKPYDK